MKSPLHSEMYASTYMYSKICWYGEVG